MHSISGCISTGKEANVYYATTEDGTNLAVKIYKTSILVFKDRDKYVSGEYRFRQGYSKSNPRKMVKLWAEKEMRNLKRLYQAGIPCPEPITLRSHVLVMTFLGSKDGWAADKLKDADLSPEKQEAMYYRLMGYVRRLWQVCHLVHADLSEYNILYYKGDIFIIDVSQSVEHEHPRAFEFLRMDIKNCTDYFRRCGVQTCNERAIFDFVTAEAGSTEMTEMVTALQDLPKGGEESIEDKVFRQAYIPQNLNQVYDIERDSAMIEQGEGDNLIYKKLVQLPNEEKKVSFGMPNLMQNEADATSSEVDEADHDDDDGDSSCDEFYYTPPALLKRFKHKHYKKEHKATVKAEKAEKRAHKMPKHLKKSKIKKTSKKK